MYEYSLDTNFKITQIQQAYNVAFHTGRIEIGNAEFNYIYDCGLNKEQFIKYYEKNPFKIDLLFISHFHSDHINDILDLIDLNIFKENTVIVMPYKDDRDKLLYAALGSLNDDNFLERFINFLERENNIWIKSDSDYIRNYNPLMHLNNSFSFNMNNYINGFENRNEEYINLFTLKYKNSGLNWGFSAYSVHTKQLDDVWNKILESDSELKQLNDRYKLSFDKEDAKKYIDKIKKVIRKIKVSDISGDKSFSNLISLSLYSGPLFNEFDLYYIQQETYKIQQEFSKFFNNKIFLNIIPYNIMNDFAGWLHTGDLNLFDEELYNNFKNFYKNIINKIAVFSIPHHGSENNFNEKIIKDFYANTFVIPEYNRVKKSSFLIEQQKLNPKKIISVSDNNSFMLETISDNILFKSKTSINKIKTDNDKLYGILKFEYVHGRINTSELLKYKDFYFTCSPKRPLQLSEDKLLFLTILDDFKNDVPKIIGRARTYGFCDSNIATDDMIKVYSGLSHYKYYVKMYDIELINSKIDDGISLYDIIEHFKKINKEMFENSKAKNSYNAYTQQSYRLITNDAKDYINQLLEQKYLKFGKNVIG